MTRRPRPADLPAGISLSKRWDGWWITHTPSGIPMHPVPFAVKADAINAVDSLEPLGIDWDQPSDAVRAAVDRSPGGRDAVRRLLLPPEEVERRRRVGMNSTRFLRALKAAGETVTGVKSYGLAGTYYTFTCGCHRSYSVSLTTGEPEEDLPIRCDKHTNLTVEEPPTDPREHRRC